MTLFDYNHLADVINLCQMQKNYAISEWLFFVSQKESLLISDNWVPREQWFLQAGRCATKGEKPPRHKTTIIQILTDKSVFLKLFKVYGIMCEFEIDHIYHHIELIRVADGSLILPVQLNITIILTAYLIGRWRKKWVTPLNSVVLGLRAGCLMHCYPWLETLGFCPLLVQFNGQFSWSDFNVSPLPPPLVAVDLAYPHYSACLLSWQSLFPLIT